MFKKRAIQLLQQRQNSNDTKLIQLLITGFSNQDKSSEFKAFEIPALFPIEHVQEVLNQIDSSLKASSYSRNKILISLSK